MTREIKFRYWTGKEMSEIRLGDDWYDMPKDIVFMQYTGLKDKNGNEIYEGDLINIGDMTICVEFDNARAKFICTSMKDIGEYWYDLCDSPAFEIAGNIYENPELI